MIRLLPAFGAFATTTCLLTGVGAFPAVPEPLTAEVIGASHPVFLGQVVVTATPLTPVPHGESLAGAND